MISPEFEAELVKKVQGQQADRSRHGAADRQLAHEICFNIDDKMLPYLLGADLSSGCAILRVLHKEVLASTAEHTAALHERFAKPVPCRDKTKLLLTLRQWLTDLKELQAAGSSPSKETVMQSLKTVTGGIRDLNNVHEITDLLSPNDPGKPYSAIERKAAGWAVMDADTRLSDSSTGAGKGARGDHKGAYSATIPCKHYAKGTCARGDKFSDKSSGKGQAKARRRKGSMQEVQRRRTTLGKRSMQEAAMTPGPSSSSEATPPGLSVSVNNSANSESVAALAAVLRDVLSPVGSPDCGRAAGLAALARSAGYVVRQKFPVFAARDQTKQLSMVVELRSRGAFGVSRSNTS